MSAYAETPITNVIAQNRVVADSSRMLQAALR
jgi:hypothetical protein